MIQGDSLANLVHLSNAVQAAIAKREWSEAEDAISELRDQLLGRLQHYERVLLTNGLELPYSGRYTEQS